MVGKRLKELRKAREWSVRRFVEESQAANRPFTAAQIENIEGVRRKDHGSRREVSVDELFGLAWVLDVSPIVLLLPAEQAEYTVTGHDQAEVLDVYRWLVGQAGRPPSTRSADWWQLRKALPWLPETERPGVRSLSVAEAGPHWNLLVGHAKSIGKDIEPHPALRRDDGAAYLQTLAPLLASILRALDEGYDPDDQYDDEEGVVGGSAEDQEDSDR